MFSSILCLKFRNSYSQFELQLFLMKCCAKASVISVGDESELPSWFRLNGKGWWVIPLMDLILFHMSVEDVFEFIEFVYFCQDSVLFFFVIYFA